MRDPVIVFSCYDPPQPPSPTTLLSPITFRVYLCIYLFIHLFIYFFNLFSKKQHQQIYKIKSLLT